MTVPAAYILRSYGGGAEPAQLVEPMGTTDTSFGITTTTGWTEANGSPLGTVGPFTVIIDRFTSTVEKITCSAVNLTTGIVTVDTTGGTGRGADGTSPQAHVPNGSPAGVQTCWTSVEAAEANKVAAYILGTLGGTPSTGQVLQWATNNPIWGTNTPVSGVAAGRMYSSGGSTLNSGVTTQATNMTQDFINGNITYASNALTVHTTGKYQCAWSIGYNLGAGNVNGGYYDSIVFQNASSVRQASAYVPSSVAQPVLGNSDLIAATAGDVFTLWGQQGSGGIEAITAGSGFTYLSLSLVSTP